MYNGESCTCLVRYRNYYYVIIFMILVITCVTIHVCTSLSYACTSPSGTTARSMGLGSDLTAAHGQNCVEAP